MSDKPLPQSPRELVNAYFEALNSGKVEDITNLFWPDATFSTTPDQTLTGQALIGSYYFELLNSRLPNAQFNVVDFKDNDTENSIDFAWTAGNETSIVTQGNDSFQYKRSGAVVLIQHYKYSRFAIQPKEPAASEGLIGQPGPVPNKAPIEAAGETVQSQDPGLQTRDEEAEYAGSAVNDRPEGKDQLGYDDYARAFARVLSNNETLTPLTIGIYGSWGMGKSFLMKRLRYFLDKAQKSRDAERRKLSWGRRFVNWLPSLRPVLPPEPEEDETPTLREQLGRFARRLIRPLTRLPSNEVEFLFIDFNAWVYSGSDNLWAGLITKLYREIEKHFGWRAVFFRLSETFRKSLAQTIKLLLLFGIPALLLSLLLNFKDIRANWNNFNDATRAVLTALTSAVIGAPVLAALPSLFNAMRELITSLVLNRSDQLAALSSRKDFRDKIGFMADIKDEIGFLSQLLRPERSGRSIRVVIFIDDLDRCPPAKAVEVLEAIILLLADENKMPFVIVLGIDARVIVKAVEERYGKVLTEAGISGYEYLDKIVQIPFRIPPAEPSDIQRYVESLIYRSDEEKARAQELVNQLATDEKVARLWNDIETLETDIISSPGLNATTLSHQLNQLTAARNLTLDDHVNYAKAEKIVAGIKEQLGRLPAARQMPVAPEPIFKPEEADTIKQFARSEWLGPNPRRVKRIVNVYRISRSLDPDTTPAHRQKLVKWIVMSEQWPFRAAWIMQYIEDDEQSEKKLAVTATLQTVFADVRSDVISKDAQAFATLEDAELFDGFIDDKNEPRLTVADIRGLRHYTFNLNPALQEEVQKAAARKKSEPAKLQTTLVKLDPALEKDLREVLDRLKSSG